MLATVVAAKVESLSIAFGVDGGCFIYSHAAERVFGHGVRLFHGSLSFLSCCSARRPRVTGIRLGGRHTCLLLVVASLCGIWQQSLSMHSECQPPLTRVRCFRRAATPPHGLSEIPQGKSCAFRDKAYMRDGHLALLPASTTLRGCGSALQHPLPAPLPRRPRQAVGDGARRAQANKPRQVCAIEYARQRELQT